MRFKNQDQSDNRADYPASMPFSSMPVTCGSYNPMPMMPSAQQPIQMPAMQPTGGQQPQPTTPTGFPTGPTTTPMLPTLTGAPAIPIGEQPPATVQSTLFTPGFLKTQIGKRMRVEFLIGTNLLTDRTGTLTGVGASYILIRPIDSNDTMLCDIYSIKFVSIFA